MAENDALAEALCESVARSCDVPVDEVDLTTSLDALGLDSLGAAEVITDLEIRLAVEFPVDVLRRLTEAETVGDVLDRLRDGLAVPGQAAPVTMGVTRRAAGPIAGVRQLP